MRNFIPKRWSEASISHRKFGACHSPSNIAYGLLEIYGQCRCKNLTFAAKGNLCGKYPVTLATGYFGITENADLSL